MEMCFKILLLTKYSFDIPGTGNCIDKNGTFSKLMMIRLKYYTRILYKKKKVFKIIFHIIFLSF